MLAVLAERALWIVGCTALGVWTAANIAGRTGAAREIQRFEAARGRTHLTVAPPDMGDWSATRVREWRDAQRHEAPAPLAVLRIPRLGIEVAVLEGTDDLTLNRAAGHIAETAAPGMPGNIGIAAHRDSFFRGLKDIAAGDLIELESLQKVDRYRVERTWIVEPDDVSVLDPTGSPAITLVTCYPFYFIGSAPQRFIVRAVDAGPQTPHTTK